MVERPEILKRIDEQMDQLEPLIKAAHERGFSGDALVAQALSRVSKAFKLYKESEADTSDDDLLVIEQALDRAIPLLFTSIKWN